LSNNIQPLQRIGDGDELVDLAAAAGTVFFFGNPGIGDPDDISVTIEKRSA